jgi:hypothetical protein
MSPLVCAGCGWNAPVIDGPLDITCPVCGSARLHNGVYVSGDQKLILDSGSSKLKQGVRPVDQDSIHKLHEFADRECENEASLFAWCENAAKWLKGYVAERGSNDWTGRSLPGNWLAKEALKRVHSLDLDGSFIEAFGDRLPEDNHVISANTGLKILKELAQHSPQTLLMKGKPPANVSVNLPGLDHEGEKILLRLLDLAPRLLTVRQIAGHTRVGGKTVGRRLKQLIKLELADRPQGPKGGATLTDKGIELARRLSVRK